MLADWLGQREGISHGETRMKITIRIEDVVSPNGEKLCDTIVNYKCGRSEDIDSMTLANLRAKKMFDAVGMKGLCQFEPVADSAKKEDVE